MVLDGNENVGPLPHWLYAVEIDNEAMQITEKYGEPRFRDGRASTSPWTCLRRSAAELGRSAATRRNPNNNFHSLIDANTRFTRVHLSPLSYARQEYFDNPKAGAPPGTSNQASTSNTSNAMATNAIGNFEEYYFGRHGLCIEPDSEGSKIVRHADKRVGTFIRARRYKSSNVDEGSGGELRARDEERAQ